MNKKIEDIVTLNYEIKDVDHDVKVSMLIRELN